jgi:predicted AAA+ superfamily ATPase
MIDLSQLFSIQDNLLKQVPRDFKRFLYGKINWKNRLIGLIGGRGTGKTTLLLQHLAEAGPGSPNYLYISADHIRVEALGIYEIASRFFQMGGEVIVIDEIHKYDGWPQEIKNLYDAFPKAHILFSGSSSLGLQLGKADLSRRAVFYNLPGLSFREYLYLSEEIEFPIIEFKDLLIDHSSFSSDIVAEGPVLRHFQNYIDHGIYPFFMEGTEEYSEKLSNIIEKVLYEDIVSTSGMKSMNVPILKRIIWLVATSSPFKPNFEKISKNLGISRPSLYIYLDYLEKSGLLSAVMAQGAGAKLARKPARIYLDNTNLLRAVSGELSREDPVGTIRETFVQHQLDSAGFQLRIPEKGDFLIENEYLFEVGGRSKGKDQITNKKNAYILKDDIDIGFGNVIPMWLIGFLY